MFLSEAMKSGQKIVTQYLRTNQLKLFFSNKYILLIIRIILGFIFVYAGAEKISNPEAFAISISNYRLLPIESLNIFAITLPWIELVAGILILFGIAVKENSTIIFSMLMVFTIAIAISLFRGLSIDCGCFGKGTQIGLLKLGENTLMIIGSFLLILFIHRLIVQCIHSIS
jgi:putative oxidoreductase